MFGTDRNAAQAPGSTPPATPRSSCGPGSRPETGLQGRVSPADHDSGRAAAGFACNTELVGSYTTPNAIGTVGGFKVERYVDAAGHECAYYDTTLLFPTNVFNLESGVNVLDMSDPTHPIRSAELQTPAMLCGGAFNSPQLLMLSGIGPRAELEKHGIEVKHQLDGVGQNLQDHLDVFLRMGTHTHVGLSFHPTFWLKGIWGFLQYVFGRRGFLSSNGAEAGGFIRSRPAEPIPDLQLHTAHFLYEDHGRNLRMTFTRYGYGVMIYDLRPLSRGRVGLKSADPLAPPLIDPDYLAHQRDVQRLVDGVREVRKIVAQLALAAHNSEEISPGSALQSDAELAEWVRRTAETAYHPVGSCKMGVDSMAVVDPRLRVHGIQGLRVVDAAVMPTVVGGNTNQPATMIAEKGAVMILADAPSA